MHLPAVGLRRAYNINLNASASEPSGGTGRSLGCGVGEWRDSIVQLSGRLPPLLSKRQDGKSSPQALPV
jgi:hypothetical protein